MDIKNKMLKDRIALLAGGVLLGLAAPKVSTAVAEKFNDTKDKTEVVSSNQIKQKKLNESLFKALEDGDLEKIKLAIKDGADINATNHKGQTPVMIAAENAIHTKFSFKDGMNYHDITNYLMENGANLLLKDNDGATVLDYAERDKFDNWGINGVKRNLKDKKDFDLKCNISKKYDEQMNSQNLSQQKGKTSYAFYQKVMKDAKQNA